MNPHRGTKRDRSWDGAEQASFGSPKLGRFDDSAAMSHPGGQQGYQGYHRQPSDNYGYQDQGWAQDATSRGGFRGTGNRGGQGGGGGHGGGVAGGGRGGGSRGGGGGGAHGGNDTGQGTISRLMNMAMGSAGSGGGGSTRGGTSGDRGGMEHSAGSAGGRGGSGRGGPGGGMGRDYSSNSLMDMDSPSGHGGKGGPGRGGGMGQGYSNDMDSPSGWGNRGGPGRGGGMGPGYGNDMDSPSGWGNRGGPGRGSHVSSRGMGQGSGHMGMDSSGGHGGSGGSGRGRHGSSRGMGRGSDINNRMAMDSPSSHGGRGGPGGGGHGSSTGMGQGSGHMGMESSGGHGGRGVSGGGGRGMEHVSGPTPGMGRGAGSTISRLMEMASGDGDSSGFTREGYHGSRGGAGRGSRGGSRGMGRGYSNNSQMDRDSSSSHGSRGGSQGGGRGRGMGRGASPMGMDSSSVGGGGRGGGGGGSATRMGDQPASTVNRAKERSAGSTISRLMELASSGGDPSAALYSQPSDSSYNKHQQRHNTGGRGAGTHSQASRGRGGSTGNPSGTGHLGTSPHGRGIGYETHPQFGQNTSGGFDAGRSSYQQHQYSSDQRGGGRGSERGGFEQQGGGRGGFDQQGGGREGFDQQGGRRGGFDQRGGGRVGFDQRGGGRGGFDQRGGGRGGFDQQGLGRGGFDQRGGGRGGFDQRGGGRGGFEQQGVGRGGFNQQHQDKHPPWRSSTYGAGQSSPGERGGGRRGGRGGQAGAGLDSVSPSSGRAGAPRARGRAGSGDEAGRGQGTRPGSSRWDSAGSQSIDQGQREGAEEQGGKRVFETLKMATREDGSIYRKTENPLLQYDKAKFEENKLPVAERFANLCKLCKSLLKDMSKHVVASTTLEQLLLSDDVCLTPAYAFKGVRVQDNTKFKCRCFRCKVYINDIFIASGVAESGRKAKNFACDAAIKVLGSKEADVIIKTHETVKVSELGKDVADMVECPHSCVESNIGILLSVPESGEKKSWADFYIKEPEEVEDTACNNSTGILKQSADFSKVLLTYQFTTSDKGIMCSVNMEGKTLATSTAAHQNKAKNLASHAALENLRKTNWTIHVVKRDKPTPAEKPLTATLGRIRPNDPGSYVRFTESLRKYLETYFAELDDHTKWLSLSQELNLQEREVVYELALEMNLKVESKRLDGKRLAIGPHDPMFLVVSKKLLCQDLFDYIFEKGGETWRYKLKPPGEFASSTD